MNQVQLLLATRADALRRGDRSVYREMDHQLERLGVYCGPEPFPFPPLDPAALAHVETASVEMPEQAVPKRKRGRPPKPRCEHDKIPERCLDCQVEDEE